MKERRVSKYKIEWLFRQLDRLVELTYEGAALMYEIKRDPVVRERPYSDGNSMYRSRSAEWLAERVLLIVGRMEGVMSSLDDPITKVFDRDALSSDVTDWDKPYVSNPVTMEMFAIYRALKNEYFGLAKDDRYDWEWTEMAFHEDLFPFAHIFADKIAIKKHEIAAAARQRGFIEDDNFKVLQSELDEYISRLDESANEKGA